MERDGLSEERAKQRLSSQTSGSNAVQYAHIILCTQWDYDYTQTQVSITTVYIYTHTHTAERD